MLLLLLSIANAAINNDLSWRVTGCGQDSMLAQSKFWEHWICLGAQLLNLSKKRDGRMAWRPGTGAHLHQRCTIDRIGNLNNPTTNRPGGVISPYHIASFDISFFDSRFWVLLCPGTMGCLCSCGYLLLAKNNQWMKKTNQQQHTWSPLCLKLPLKKPGGGLAEVSNSGKHLPKNRITHS